MIGGLRFSIPQFFVEVSEYVQIPLQQLASNSYRLLCGVVIIFHLYHIPLTRVFYYLFCPKKMKVGIFYFTARSSCSFLDKIPSSHKGWKAHYVFAQPPLLFLWPIDWQLELSIPTPLPSLGQYKLESTFHTTLDILSGLQFDVKHMLKEGLLFLFGLSSIDVELHSSFGKTCHVFVLCDD